MFNSHSILDNTAIDDLYMDTIYKHRFKAVFLTKHSASDSLEKASEHVVIPFRKQVSKGPSQDVNFRKKLTNRNCVTARLEAGPTAQRSEQTPKRTAGKAGRPHSPHVTARPQLQVIKRRKETNEVAASSHPGR